MQFGDGRKLTFFVDEVSMMGQKLLESVEFIARNMRNNQKFFGSMQVVTCGEFFQLPPSDQWIRKGLLHKGPKCLSNLPGQLQLTIPKV